MWSELPSSLGRIVQVVNLGNGFAARFDHCCYVAIINLAGTVMLVDTTSIVVTLLADAVDGMLTAAGEDGSVFVIDTTALDTGFLGAVPSKKVTPQPPVVEASAHVLTVLQTLPFANLPPDADSQAPVLEVASVCVTWAFLLTLVALQLIIQFLPDHKDAVDLAAIASKVLSKPLLLPLLKDNLCTLWNVGKLDVDAIQGILVPLIGFFTAALLLLMSVRLVQVDYKATWICAGRGGGS